jgi:hypothetical protein
MVVRKTLLGYGNANFDDFSEELGIRAFGLSGTRKAFPCLKPAKPKQVSDVDLVRLTFVYFASLR